MGYNKEIFFGLIDYIMYSLVHSLQKGRNFNLFDIISVKLELILSTRYWREIIIEYTFSDVYFSRLFVKTRVLNAK